MTDRAAAEADAAVAADERYLRRALTLARRGRYRTSPNPMVGCVVVRDGAVVAEGYHRQVGGPHAEAEALAHAGDAARGATVFTNLEPCDHQGRTPPCSRALLAAGVRRVVVCHRDPNALAAGGLARLAAAGVAVACGTLARPAVHLNWKFLVAALLGRPAVTLKWAASLDGKIATQSGHSQWISSPASLRWALDERETHDAIVAGSGTALADDPRLDRRLGRAAGPNLRVVLDRRLRLRPEARMLRVAGPVLVYAGPTADPDRVRALEAQGAEVAVLAEPTPEHVLADLYRRGVRSVLVEGGGAVAAAFVAADLVDRVAAVLAPMLIGGSRAVGPLAGVGVDTLSAAPRLDRLRVSRRGDDLLIQGFRSRCLPDLYASVGA